MGKSDKVECVGSPPARLCSCGPAEVEEAALLWMQLEPVFPEALRQYLHDPPRIFLILKADDKVVGKPHQETMPSHPWLYFGLEPHVQYIVEIDIRQQGADDAPYNVAKHSLELTVSIDRIQLKGNYGKGFGGAPLRVASETDRAATGNRDNGRGEEATQGASSTGDKDHV